MISVILRDLRWRFALLIPVALALYALEPGFHQHDGFDAAAVALGPLGVSATLSYLAGLSMIVLLGGFISGERREGHTRLILSQPTAPLSYYGVRWGTAYVLSMVAAILFLVIGQLVAWGEFRGGWAGLALPATSALLYGGVLAFFSALLNRGDTWVTFLVFLPPTFFPELLNLGLSTLRTGVRQAVLLLLPPTGALQEIWEGLLFESFAFGALLFAVAYGLVFLLGAAAVLMVREWP